MTGLFRIHQTGGPEQLRWENLQLPSPGNHEIRIRHTAIGVNYIDTYLRSGLYPMALPGRIGFEATGVVKAVGSDVSDFKIGERVGYCFGQSGAYAEENNVPAELVVKIPDAIDDQFAAATMLKGCTACYLLKHGYPVKPGDTVLFHAAAGGVGILACQWAKYLGATVIGTVGDQEKARIAYDHGCDHVIVYREENIVERVMEITGGQGVHAVYDGVGKSTFEASLDSLKTFGTLVSFGNASGPVEPFAPLRLGGKSLFLTRPTLAHHVKPRERLLQITGSLFDMLNRGIIKPLIKNYYPLQEAAQAHRDLEARRTSGSIILLRE
ncbi:MAG: quinone oxidoreductase [Gammaproteobacteria bacterium]|nr:quinone oxidoreductase [Gammaproteobacteria bacterium]